MKNKTLFSQLLILSVITLFACKKDHCEATNILNNSSFETVDVDGFPIGWEYCGFQNAEDPAMEEAEIYGNSEFTKELTPFDGENYVVLIATDNNTWEMIGQELSQGLEQNASYELSLACARQASYVGYSTGSQSQVNYTTPIKFQIWGGNNSCEKEELLYSSELIINTRWLAHTIEFAPSQDFSHLMIEAAFRMPIMFPYNGNVMIDKVELFKVN